MSFVKAADKLLSSSEDIKFPQTNAKTDPSLKMKAVIWEGNEDVRVIERPKPIVTEPQDAIIRVTSATLCGSDLHLYHNEFSGIEKGDIMGHEAMGIVESVGNEVEKLRPGDRVVISPVLSDGVCKYCKEGYPDSCETTNPSKVMEKMIGHRCAGLLGYSHLTGGYEGVFAEYVRVPFAEHNLLKVPDHLPDEKVLFLADSLTTAWHACENAEIDIRTPTVAIWGCGPVGLFTIMLIKQYRSPNCKLIAIDCIEERLRMAEKMGADKTINFGEKDVLEILRELVPGGPDVCIDAVGFRFPKSLLHKMQRALRIETDSPQVLQECITAVKKRGLVSIIGDYYGLSSQFPTGK